MDLHSPEFDAWCTILNLLDGLGDVINLGVQEHWFYNTIPLICSDLVIHRQPPEAKGSLRPCEMRPELSHFQCLFLSQQYPLR